MMKTRDKQKVYIGIEMFWLPTRDGDYILRNPDLFYSFDFPREHSRHFLLLWDAGRSLISVNTILYYYSICDPYIKPKVHPCMPFFPPVLRFVCVVPSDISKWDPDHPFPGIPLEELPYTSWHVPSVVFCACASLGDRIKFVTHENFEKLYQGLNPVQEEPRWNVTENGYRKALRRFEHRAKALLAAITSVSAYNVFFHQYKYVMGCITELSYYVDSEVWNRTAIRIEREEVELCFQPWYAESEMKRRRFPDGLMLIKKGKRYYLYDYEGGRRLVYHKEDDTVEETCKVTHALPYNESKHVHTLPKDFVPGATFFITAKGKKKYISENVENDYT